MIGVIARKRRMRQFLNHKRLEGADDLLPSRRLFRPPGRVSKAFFLEPPKEQQTSRDEKGDDDPVAHAQHLGQSDFAQVAPGVNGGFEQGIALFQICDCRVLEMISQASSAVSTY